MAGGGSGGGGKDLVKQNIGKIVTAVMAVYFVFFLNLGTRTFAGHVIRISTTPEARDMAEEIYETSTEAARGLTSRARGLVSGFSKREH